MPDVPYEALRGQRAAMAAALTAEPFDPEAVAKVLASETKLIGDLSARGRELLLAEIGRMSAAERAAYAEEIREGRGPGRGRRGRGPT